MATTPATPETSGVTNTAGLAPWAAGYITDYLGKAQALANTPYQVYQGPLTAGPSALQQQAFGGIGALTVPGSLAGAAGTLGSAASQAAGMSYSPTSITSNYQAPGAYSAVNVGDMYTAPAAYTAAQFQNQFTAPGAYQPGTISSGFTAPGAYRANDFSNVQFKAPDAYTPTDFSQYKFNAPDEYQSVGGSFTEAGVADRYMNPYLQQMLEPTLEEIRRQAEISLQPQLDQLTAAGAYGGSREAILRGEAQRALLNQVARTTGETYATGYDKAAAQFNAEQGRKIQEAQFAAQQGMTRAELEARYGIEVARAAEQAKQFGATQAMTAADLAARYQLAAAQAGEQSRQFGAGQSMTAADLAARYQLAEQQAREQASQFGATQAMTAADLMARYGLSAQQAAEQSRQYANTSAMQSAANEAQYGLQGLQIGEQSRQYGAGLAADAAKTKAQFDLAAQQASEQSRQFGATYGLDALAKQIQAAQAQGQVGAAESQAAQGNAALMLQGGAQQQAIDQAGVAADYAEFLRQQRHPYEQVQFMRDMISGLPYGSVSSSPAELSTIARLAAAAGGIDSLMQNTGGGSLNELLGNLFGGNLGGSSAPESTGGE